MQGNGRLSKSGKIRELADEVLERQGPARLLDTLDHADKD
jgi:hypothetical protein